MLAGGMCNVGSQPTTATCHRLSIGSQHYYPSMPLCSQPHYSKILRTLPELDFDFFYKSNMTFTKSCIPPQLSLLNITENKFSKSQSI